MARKAHFYHSSPLLAGAEHLLQPPEAPVWACAALVWCLHHRHRFGPLLQVGPLKCRPHIAGQLMGDCLYFWPPPRLFGSAQEENHVPKHSQRHRADDRREGGHRLRLQQPHQEGNCHVCNSLLQAHCGYLLHFVQSAFYNPCDDSSPLHHQ